MRILLFGEYSNVHYTLSHALRRQGHEVLLISDGDGWKDYPRDIDLRRRIKGPWGSLLYLSKLLTLLPRLQGFDVVQLINPIFLDVKPRWNRWLFDYLKRHNSQVSLGCFGDDYFVVSRMLDSTYLTYTDFFANGKVLDHQHNRQRIESWCQTERRELTQYIATHADSLMACLYEYYKVYNTDEFSSKLHYMPLPIENGVFDKPQKQKNARLQILVAIQHQRSKAKGTDLILPLLERLAQQHPEKINLHTIVNVPFSQFQKEVEEADVVVDQLYSYTPAMGALEAMRQGKVVISGYEPEFAQFLAQQEAEGVEPAIVPGILNLRPFEDEANYRLLEETLLDRQKIARLSADSQAYVQKYHNADDVARKCVAIWESLIEKRQSCTPYSSLDSSRWSSHR